MSCFEAQYRWLGSTVGGFADSHADETFSKNMTV
jgi:hypothetical protein